MASCSLGQDLVSYQAKTLLDCKEDLVLALKNTDLKKFSEELLECCVLSEEVSDLFSSLDYDRLDSRLGIRYLLQCICEEVKHDGRVVMRFVDVLGRLGGSVAQVYKILCKRLEECTSDPGSGGQAGRQEERNTLENDYLFSDDDVSILTDLLVKVAYAWEKIAIAVNLPTHIIEQCNRRSHDDNILAVNYVLRAWITGECKGAIPTTWGNLKSKLGSLTVGEGRVAQEIEQKFAEAKMPTLLYQAKRKRLDSTLTIERQSKKIEVFDGKSTLLGVQVSPNESVSYQWMKNGQPLSDGLVYSNVHSDILVISHACQGIEGKYTCCVSIGIELIKSRAVDVNVLFPPEKTFLIKSYSRQSEVPKNLWPPVGTSTFINLVLIKQNGGITREHDYSVRGDMDDIIKEKEKTKYEQVFGKYIKGGLVLVEGRPGSGKTTLVHKVTRDWATRGDILANAKLVFLVPLRVLNSKKTDHTLPCVLELFYRDKSELQKVLSDVCRLFGEGVCFIIDGLDEYQPEDKEKSVIYPLLCKKYLPDAMIIIASRPWATAGLRTDPVTKHVEVLGFVKNQIFEYIDKFPFESPRCSDVSSTKNLPSRLKAYLELHYNVLHMCYLPVHAAMICFLSQYGETIPHTETKIYEEFTRLILLRWLRRSNRKPQLPSLNDLCGNDKECFDKICFLAFDMTINSKQVIHQRDTEVSLSPECGPDEALSLGLVTIDRTVTMLGLTDTYTFLHLTFQEYLAAFYISKLEEEKQVKIVEQYGEHEQMLMVWVFYCGMTKFEEGDARLDSIFSYLDDLYRLRCAFESQQCVVCESILESSNERRNISVNGCRLTLADITAIAYVMSATRHPVTEVNMRKCYLNEDKLSFFFAEVGGSQLKAIESLNIWRNYIGSEGMAVLVDELKHCCNLQRLDVGDNCLGSDGTAVLADGLGNSRLQELILTYNAIGSSGAKALVDGLKCRSHLQLLDLSQNLIGGDDVSPWDGLKNWTNLRILKLEYNRIDSCDLAALAEGLKYGCLQELYLFVNEIGPSGIKAEMKLDDLQVLDLSGNEIGSEGAAFLASVLKSNIRELHLSGNMIGSEGAACLASGLKSNIQVLHLSGNNIGLPGIIAIVKSLKFCSHLRVLDLSNNSVGSEGVAHICEGLKHWSSLQELYLSSAEIDTGGAIALAEGLKYCNTLHTLDVNKNNINSPGALAIADGLKLCPHMKDVGISSEIIDSDHKATLNDKLKGYGKILDGAVMYTVSVCQKQQH